MNHTEQIKSLAHATKEIQQGLAWRVRNDPLEPGEALTTFVEVKEWLASLSGIDSFMRTITLDRFSIFHYLFTHMSEQERTLARLAYGTDYELEDPYAEGPDYRTAVRRMREVWNNRCRHLE